MGGIIYAIGQGFKNLFRNKWYTVASVATMTACLFLFSLVFVILINFESMLHSAEQGVSVTVFFNEGVTEEQILQLKIGIEERSEVSSVEYVSADQAWADFAEDYLGEYAEGFTENPLADSANLEIYLSDVSKQGDLVEYLEKIDIVREVNRSEIVADTLSNANNLISYVFIGMITILLVNTVFLISNTVIAGIAVRSNEINIMKYIGATDAFVRGPFIIEGIVIGFVGSMIPLGLTYVVYNAAVDVINNRFSMLSGMITFIPIETLMQTLVPITIALGVGIGFFGSWATTRRHINV